jgi:tRNA nucleotidyltransferase (CCA-adding enzyme)
LKLVEGLAGLPAKAVFVGRCVREALAGTKSSDFEVLTDAPPKAILELFPHGVVLGPQRTTHAGAHIAIDVVSLEPGRSIEDALAGRDLSVNAIGLDPLAKEIIDPFGGLEDLAAKELRPTRPAVLNDPLCGIRACSLVSREGFDATPELLVAMQASAPHIRQVARARIRAELRSMLLGIRVEAGLTLLRDSGLEAQLAPDVDASAARWVSLLPPDLSLRLTAWLKGARTIRVLRRLRFPRVHVEAVEFFLRNHPVEEQATSGQHRRRLARHTTKTTSDLYVLRRSEIAAKGEGPAAQRLLDDTLESIEAFRQAERDAMVKPKLALDGRGIMTHLACRPGRKIGRALAFLESQIAQHPERNQPDILRAALDTWEDDT